MYDNFARNRDWEAIFDRLILMQERDGISIHLVIQVDMMCHKIPRFIEKAAKAGVRRVFIGLEFFFLTPLPGSAGSAG